MGNKENRLTFQADLFTLSKQYFQIIMHLRQTGLFKQRNQRLQNAVDQYLRNYPKFNKKDLDLLAVDTSHKLHPLDFGTRKIDKQYLINACLRQQQFCQKLHVKCITFEQSLIDYENFLKVVKARPGKITVPSLKEDFMWHSHMRDHEKYRRDMKKILGFVLNHDDEIPKEKLKNYWDDALQKRQKVFQQKFHPYQI